MAGTKKEAPKWSQFDEEPILSKIFEVAGSGVCADIGARGRIGSNVAFLIDRGWKAQLIDRGINCLLKDFPFTLFPNVTIVQAEISAKNVNRFLWKDPIDLLSIDIDGPDADVWEAMTARPRVLVIEAMDHNRAKIMKISEERGYKLHAETGPNLIYIQQIKRVKGDWWPERDKTCHTSAYGILGADLATNLCKKTDLVIQAGANVGVWPRYLKRKFKRVMAFEPSVENFGLMVKNLSGVDVEMFHAALGDREGRCNIKPNPLNCGDDQTVPGNDVLVMAIDDLEVDPDLIYLDIQGDELPALKGAVKTIERCSPVIAVEIDGKAMRKHGDPRPFLMNLGYRRADRAHQDEIFVRDV